MRSGLRVITCLLLLLVTNPRLWADDAPPPPVEPPAPPVAVESTPPSVMPPPAPEPPTGQPVTPPTVPPAASPEDETPQPNDIQIEYTSRFEVERAWKLSKTLPRKKMVEILTDAAVFVESKFPSLDGFEKIHTNKRLVVCVCEQVLNENEIVLGKCQRKHDCIVVSVSAQTLIDGETPVHEFVHAMLRGNEINPSSWLEEGIARYVEDRKGYCPAVRDQLLRYGVLTKTDLATAKATCHTGANGFVVVRYLVIRGHDLAAVALFKDADIPEPFDAFAHFIDWDRGLPESASAIMEAAVAPAPPVPVETVETVVTVP